MPSIRVRPRSEDSSLVEHLESEAQVTVVTPPEYGGPGGAFSATDLLAAALGACVASSVGALLARDDIPTGSFEVRVGKRLGQAPKRVKALHVTIALDAELDPLSRTRVLRAASTCPVGRSLSPELELHVELSERSTIPSQDSKP